MSIGAFHYGTLGDIIYSLPSLEAMIDQWGHEDVAFGLAVGHPLPDDTIDHSDPYARYLYLSLEQAVALMPLLNSQPFIDHVDVAYYEELRADYVKTHEALIDLNEFRGAVLYGWHGVHLAERYFLQYNVSARLSEPWLVLPEKTSLLGITREHRALIENDPIVLNFTGRYPNPHIDRSTIAEFCQGKPTIFLGLGHEYSSFVESTGCECTHIWVNDYLQMAYIISKAAMFLGNQSFAYTLADALSVPLVLEVAPLADHARPYTHGAYTVINQPQLRQVLETVAREVFHEDHEYYFESMEEG